MARAIVTSLILIALTWPTAVAAQGSFHLCYERLKQVVVLHQVQGGKAEVVIDDPREREYRVILQAGQSRHALWCTAKGELMVEDEE
jgi:hypothetical protein